MGAPNVHTCSRINVPNAVSGSETHPAPWTPNTSSTALTSPSEPKILRHKIATATLPPSSDGR